jgi:hypothetical protein
MPRQEWGLNFAPIFALIVILCGVPARLWLRYSVLKSFAASAIILGALYALFFSRPSCLEAPKVLPMGPGCTLDAASDSHGTVSQELPGRNARQGPNLSVFWRLRK